MKIDSKYFNVARNTEYLKKKFVYKNVGQYTTIYNNFQN